MEKFIQELPKDVIMRIICFLDIDSRRALNIYTKIKIPQNIVKRIENKLQIPDVFYNDRFRFNSFSAKIDLNNIYIIRKQITILNDEKFINYYVEHNNQIFNLPDIYISRTITENYVEML